MEALPSRFHTFADWGTLMVRACHRQRDTVAQKTVPMFGCFEEIDVV
jgi:hypothetical protein